MGSWTHLPTYSPDGVHIQIDPDTHEPFIPFKVPIFANLPHETTSTGTRQREIVGWKDGYRLAGPRPCLTEEEAKKLDEDEAKGSGLPKKRLEETRGGEDDVRSMRELFDQKGVSKWMVFTPCPYPLATSRRWYLFHGQSAPSIMEYLSSSVVRESVEENGNGKKLWNRVSGCPFYVVRFSDDPVSAGGKMMGSLDLILTGKGEGEGPGGWKRPWFDVNGELGEPEKPAYEREWDTGGFLSEDLQGQGIMTCALRALLDCYIKPFLQLGVLKPSSTGRIWLKTMEGNWGIRKMYEKNGFKLIATNPMVEDRSKLDDEKFLEMMYPAVKGKPPTVENVKDIGEWEMEWRGDQYKIKA